MRHPVAPAAARRSCALPALSHPHQPASSPPPAMPLGTQQPLPRPRLPAPAAACAAAAGVQPPLQPHWQRGSVTAAPPAALQSGGWHARMGRSSEHCLARETGRLRPGLLHGGMLPPSASIPPCHSSKRSPAAAHSGSLPCSPPLPELPCVSARRASCAAACRPCRGAAAAAAPPAAQRGQGRQQDGCTALA